MGGQRHKKETCSWTYPGEQGDKCSDLRAGSSSYCREHANLMTRARRYNLHHHDMWATLILNEVCSICEKEFGDDLNDKCIDHCHHDGNIRGVLCRNCNTSMKENVNVDWLLKAIKYLHNFESGKMVYENDTRL